MTAAVERYCIKPGYAINPEPRPYRDTLEDAGRYQVEVYRHAGRLALQREARSVLDVGCGLATKLVEYIAPCCPDITGIDTDETIAQCRERFPSRSWLAADIEAPALALHRRYDLIVSADVIEHLLNPDRLLDLIRAASHEATTVVLSTPDRDRRRGPDDMGPPGNWSHVREWNVEEFRAYLESRGFRVDESRIVDLREGMPSCHLVVGAFERRA